MIVRKFLLVVFAACLYFCLSFASNQIGASYLTLFSSEDESTLQTTEEDKKNTIQVALLLDTSGSMSGLIEQAKSQLWSILNELARTEKQDQETRLEIALYEYGNPSKTRAANQINQLIPFTTDMDVVSAKLFSLNTSGGEEYCGTVIHNSIAELDWTNANDLKVIYIAGNEEFTQGIISYKTACQKAQEKGVIINTIYCGDYETGIKEYWLAGAKAGGGEYLNINHNKETVYISTPYDDEINRLNIELNKTYIPIGESGRTQKLNQSSQDNNANKYSTSNAADRAVFKSSKKYKATSWDLADAYKKDKNVIIEKKELLPDTLKTMTTEELEITIRQITTQRVNIQNEIQALDKKRRTYKAENQKDTDSSLQNSIISSIKKQANSKGFEVKE